MVVDTGGGNRPPSPASCIWDAVKAWAGGVGNPADGVHACAEAIRASTASGQPVYPVRGGSGIQGPGGILAGAIQVSGSFPRTASPNATLYRADPVSGLVTNYEVYDIDGLPVKRVDLTGRAHDAIPTPHVHEFIRETNPRTGELFVTKGVVRPALPQEIP